MSIINVKQNNSFQSMNIDHQLFVKLLINIFTLSSVSFAIIVSLFIIVYVFIIYNLRNHSQNSFNVSLLLTCNTCFSIICSSIIHILMQLSSISGDRNVVALKWIIVWGCHVRGYLLFVFINSIYVSYVLQAGYRLFRIVFHEHRCLQTASNFLYYILALWIVSFVALIPTLITGKNLETSIVYLPEDFYCQVPVTNIFTMIYLVIIVYVSPLCCLCIIYLWIIIYIRRNTRRKELATRSTLRRENKRDSIIMKRICIVVFSFLIPVVASIIFFIVCGISGHFHWAFYRLNGMAISISYAFICLSSIYITPEIFKPIRSLFRLSNCYQRNLEDPVSFHRITKPSTITIENLGLRKMTSVNMIEHDLFQQKSSHARSTSS
jgi:hypothetical protein